METLNLCYILKYAPKGLRLYSLLSGYCTFDKIQNDGIICIDDKNRTHSFTSDGKFYNDGETILFPSKEHQTWDDWQSVLFKNGTYVQYEQKYMYIIRHLNPDDNNMTASVSTLRVGAPHISDLPVWCFTFAKPDDIVSFKEYMSRMGYIEKNGEIIQKDGFQSGDIIQSPDGSIVAIYSNSNSCAYDAERNVYKNIEDWKQASDKQIDFFKDAIQKSNLKWTGDELTLSSYSTVLKQLEPFSKIMVKYDKWRCEIVSHIETHDGKETIYLIGGNSIDPNKTPIVVYHNHYKQYLGTSVNIVVL